MKSDFIVAVHALVYLTHLGTLVSSDELARNICTNPVRVRKIMGKLKKLGLVETKEGHVGFYYDVSVNEKATILTIADGLGISFVDTKWRSGTEDMDCFISSGMSLVFDRLYEEMDRACREELKHITLESIAQEVVERQRARMEKCHGERCHDCPAWDRYERNRSRS